MSEILSRRDVVRRAEQFYAQAQDHLTGDGTGTAAYYVFLQALSAADKAKCTARDFGLTSYKFKRKWGKAARRVCAALIREEFNLANRQDFTEETRFGFLETMATHLSITDAPKGQMGVSLEELKELARDLGLEEKMSEALSRPHRGRGNLHLMVRAIAARTQPVPTT